MVNVDIFFDTTITSLYIKSHILSLRWIYIFFQLSLSYVGKFLGLLRNHIIISLIYMEYLLFKFND